MERSQAVEDKRVEIFGMAERGQTLEFQMSPEEIATEKKNSRELDPESSTIYSNLSITSFYATLILLFVFGLELLKGPKRLCLLYADKLIRIIKF